MGRSKFRLANRWVIANFVVQLAFDVVLFVLAFALLDPWLVAASLLGAVIVNLIIAVNHRRERRHHQVVVIPLCGGDRLPGRHIDRSGGQLNRCIQCQ